MAINVYDEHVQPCDPRASEGGCVANGRDSEPSGYQRGYPGATGEGEPSGKLLKRLVGPVGFEPTTDGL